MYKVIGADGREYGPIDLEQLAQWAAQGRVNLQTRVKSEGESDWKPASEIPEFQAIFEKARGAVPPSPVSAVTPPSSGQEKKGLAITSFVLGILSVACLNPVTALPAIMCGHVAHNRSRRTPAEYGGAGLAIAGFVMGYAGLVLSLVIYSAMLFPALSQAKNRAQTINCVNNMKQIGLAFRTWELDHNDRFPFNVKTNAGGTLELCQRGPDGFDKNSAAHFLVMSNELSTPRVLVCPADTRQAATDWGLLQPVNVTYQVRSGEGVNDSDPQQVLAVCPVHNNVLRVDGSVQQHRQRSRTR